MVRLGENLSLLDASCCSLDVMNGGGLDEVIEALSADEQAAKLAALEEG